MGPDNHAVIAVGLVSGISLPSVPVQSMTSSSPRRSPPPEDPPVPLGENSGALRELIKETVQEILSARTPNPPSAGDTQTGEPPIMLNLVESLSVQSFVASQGRSQTSVYQS